MISTQDYDALLKAASNKLQVVLTYKKKTTEEINTYTIGIQEIGGVNKAGSACIWGWDVQKNDHIRDFLIDNIQRVQVLDTPYYNVSGFPIKVNGVEVGY